MDTVGIRELKAHLSRHLRRVRSGARLLVTERGRVIASLDPVEAPHGLEWARALVATGQAHWGGGKPEGCRHPVPTAGGRTVSAVVLEERR
jgi:prevent-host-death family protein